MNTPNYDQKVKIILDGLVPAEQTCVLTGEKWLMDEEEIGWYKRFNVPPSKVHPLSRVKITTFFGTGFGWWWNKHAKTGKPVLSYVHPATGIKVLPDPEFFEQDNTDKGREYNPSTNFFDQIRTLQLEVPFTAWRSLIVPINSVALLSQGDENSFFVTGCKSKNSFYAYCAEDMENSAEVFESLFVVNSYNILNSNRIHNCKFVRQSFDCMNSDFLFDCRNCESCFGATNKRNGKYIWFNEQLSKEEWEKRRAEVDLGSRTVLEEYIAKFQGLVGHKAIWPENFNEQTENCIGEYLQKCRQCKYMLAGHDSQDNYYGAVFLGNSENNAFVGGALQSFDNIYSHAPLKSRGCKYVHSCYECQNMEYCMQCYNCENCFGCVGLIRKKFCIFNKQYEEAEYWQRVDELKCAMLDRGEYGEFFPAKFAPSYWPVSVGLLYQIEEDEATKLGVNLLDPESAGALGELAEGTVLHSLDELPDHINQTEPEKWGGVPFMDPAEKRRYALLKPEIALYKQLGIAIRSMHPMKRLKSMVFEANSGNFIDSKCFKCGKAVVVATNKTYPDRTIYCREDYLKFIEENG
ncbi:MAG: hypothetical protein AAB865_01705 [Patescibacteria group bacterium]